MRRYTFGLEAADLPPKLGAFVGSDEWVHSRVPVPTRILASLVQRYLRLPLSALAGIVGTRGPDKHGTPIDKYRDSQLSCYKAKGDNEYIRYGRHVRLPDAHPQQAGRRQGARHEEAPRRRPLLQRFQLDSRPTTASSGWTSPSSAPCCPRTSQGINDGVFMP